MGVAIIEVMLIHYLDWVGASKVVIYLSKPLTGLVFTEGFLLLSGLGLYYSFKKDNNIISFYKRRLYRLVLPFILISLPFYLYQWLAYNLSLSDMLIKISALWYWYRGNEGMWYVSVSVLLYFLFPFIYRFLFGNDKVLVIKVKCVILISLSYGIALLVHCFFPNYFLLINEGLTQMPMFVIGIMIGYLSYNSLHFKGEYLFVVILGLLAIGTNLVHGIIGGFGTGFLRLFCTLLLCLVLARLEMFTGIVKIYDWVKKVT